jgi:Family of unknown function (DUF6186)
VKLSTVIWYLLYALPVVGMFVLWWLGRTKPQSVARLSSLVEHIMINRTTRIAVITVWWWLGWHFFSD